MLYQPRSLAALGFALLTVFTAGSVIGLARAEEEESDKPRKPGRSHHQMDADTMFDHIDADGDGVVTKEEFKTAFENRKKRMHEGRQRRGGGDHSRSGRHGPGRPPMADGGRGRPGGHRPGAGTVVHVHHHHYYGDASGGMRPGFGRPGSGRPDSGGHGYRHPGSSRRGHDGPGHDGRGPGHPGEMRPDHDRGGREGHPGRHGRRGHADSNPLDAPALDDHGVDPTAASSEVTSDSTSDNSADASVDSAVQEASQQTSEETPRTSAESATDVSTDVDA